MAGDAPDARAKSPEQAATDATDGDRLLPGEDPASRDPDDVAHWTTVYRELLDFKDQVIETATETIAGMETRDSRNEAMSTDLTLLSTERDHLRDRLRFWLQRGRSLVRRDDTVAGGGR